MKANITNDRVYTAGLGLPHGTFAMDQGSHD